MRSNEVITSELVKKFLGKLNPTGWRTNRKAALDEFESALMKDGDQLVITEGSLITQLLVGCKQYPKGLLKICGEHSVSNIVGPSLTRASIMGLKLLSRLLNPSEYSGATNIVDHLKSIPVSALSLPNFAHHLIRDHSDGELGPHVFEPPMRVISTFLCYIPNLHLSDFIADDWARYFFLRRCIGYHYQSPNDKFWLKSVQTQNFSKSIVVEFLTTSKHRMGREVWLKNMANYIVKCKPILTQDTIETFLAGIPKTTTKGLLKMCNFKKSYSGAAKEVLAQMLDNRLYPDAGRIADFLLEHRDLLALLNYPQVFEKHVSIPIDTKIYNTLMTRAKVGEVKDVLILLHGEESQAIPLDSPNRDRRNTSSLDSLTKTYRKMHRKTFSSVNDISWGDKNSQGSYPSVLSKLDEAPQDQRVPLPLSAPASTTNLSTITPIDTTSSTSTSHTPYSPSTYPISPDLPSSFPPSFPTSPSTSPSSSPRTSDEFSDPVFGSVPPTSLPPLSLTSIAPPSLPSPRSIIPPEISPRSRLGTESFRAQDMVIAALEHFFEEHSPIFSRLEYRRLLIFLMSIVNSQSDDPSTMESMFSELGLDNKPQHKNSVTSLFETLDDLAVNFTDELCTMWTASLMREIATTERNLDP